jgi:signal peptidase II
MPECALPANRRKRTISLAADNQTRLLWPIFVALAIAVVDQISKFWAVNALTNQPPVEIFGSSFMLTLVYNDGGAMGTNLGSSLAYLIISLIIMPVLAYYIYSHRTQPSMSIPLSSIAGGAIGNIIDRIRLGRVVDFLDVDIPDVNILGYQLERWWTFNVADTAISCGIIFILAHMIFTAAPSRQTELDSKQPENNSITID